MAEFALRELIDEKRLQHLQNEFCKVTGVTAVCVDKEGRAITEPYIDKSLIRPDGEDPILGEYRKKAAQALDRVQEGSLEEQVVEELPDGGHVAAVAVSVENQIILYWQVYDLKKLDTISFYQILDLLRDTSADIYRDRMSCFSAEAESRRSRYAEEEMSRNLHTIEATTEIVQLLDSDEQIELTMSRWLKILAQHIQVDSAEIFQLQADTDTMNVVCEWLAPGLISYFDKTSGIPEKSFLHTEKPLVVSTDSVGKPDSEEIEKIGMKAVMIFPILKQESGNMVLSLNHRRQGHVWSMAEIKFTSDAVKILQSILTRRIQKNSLAGSYAALEEILDNVGCAIYVTDQNTGRMLFANQILKNTFAKELMDHNFDALLQSSVRKDKNRTVSVVYHAEKETWYDLLCKEIAWVDGKYGVDALVEKYPNLSSYNYCANNPVKFIDKDGNYWLKTDKKLYQRRIEQQAYTDFLTGLYNRMCCERDLARQIDQAKKIGGKGALLYLDLDDFKHINDGLGHQYGDVLLKSISHALKRINGIENTCYRMGGDEFVIIIPPDSYPRFGNIVEDIKKIFSKPWFLKDADYYCTMSMGIVTFPDAGDSVTDLIKKADIAMYEAKKTGKNRVETYREGNDSVSGRRLDMEKNMRDATVEGYREFEVYYQPIIDIQGGKDVCAGAEALIRWNSAKLGFISPAEFIPLAEYLGLINPIGNYVLTEACTRCKHWNDTGYPDYKVNVNLSVVQLLQPDIVETVEKALADTGLSPKNLTLEVTESLAINDMDRMKEILNRIKALGVSLALDDFGTGYSSLNHIREIPIDVIKVDQSFVKDLAGDAYSQSFIKMVAELAQTIGVSVCVEGIETPEQFKVLQGMKVKYIQGYYFDRPMERHAFEAKYVK